MPFEKWESGEELFASMNRDEDLLDRDLRVWAEECDQMQGIQVYAGGDDAWGGFASRYVERLRDEFGKMTIWSWGIEEEQGKGPKAKRSLRTLNTARTLYDMSTHASIYIPLSIPATPLPRYIHLDRDSRWHVSALQSVAVESMTLPSRTRSNVSNRGLLNDLEAALNINGNQKIAQLQCSLFDPDTRSVRSLPGYGGNDDRAPSDTNYTMVREDAADSINTDLDIMLSGGEQFFSARSKTEQRSPDHIFGALEEVRGNVAGALNEEMNEDEVFYAKKRRLFAGLPVFERFVMIAPRCFASNKISGIVPL